ncbi:MAG: hypothetical protein WBP26_02540 [Candidatus Saccharimonadales bacterium]
MKRPEFLDTFQDVPRKYKILTAAIAVAIGASAYAAHEFSPTAPDSYNQLFVSDNGCLLGTEFDPNKGATPVSDEKDGTALLIMVNANGNKLLSFSHGPEPFMNPWASPVEITFASFATARYLGQQGCPLPGGM